MDAVTEIAPAAENGKDGGIKMSVKIYVRDNTNGKVHEYGTSQHDALILQEDGSLHYHNFQNGCGTIFSDDGYTFCLADGSDPRTRENYIQYGVEPCIDIGGNGEDHTCVTCGWISVKDRLPEVGGYVVCIAKRNPFSRFMPMVARIEKNGWVNPITEQYISEVTHWMPLPDPPEM